jgi:hypothetical protein
MTDFARRHGRDGLATYKALDRQIQKWISNTGGI